MKKRLLSVVLALTMVVGSFNVVFAGSDSATLIDTDYAYATAYAECEAYTGFASTSCYPTDEVTSVSSYVSADLYYGTRLIGDSGSDSSGFAGTLNVSVELAYYAIEAVKVESSHEVTLDGVDISTDLRALR